MLLIWGSRGRIKKRGFFYDDCIICQNTTKFELSFARRWFTLFFIPIFPISQKQYYLECLQCENCYKITENVDIEKILEQKATKHENF